MSRIGVLGGSFDPCHRGHINLAVDAKEQMNLDEVILMPTRIQPFKQDKKVADANHRVNMLKEAIKECSGLSVSTWEIDQKTVSYTYKTLEALKKIKGEDAEIYFISGTDSFINIESWKNGKDMLRKHKFIVGVRPGYRLNELDEAIAKAKKIYGTDVHKIDNRRFHISSTEIRDRLKNNQSISDLVTDSVERYILENGLYVE